jgi:5-hydroxyisourate hydrolase
MGISTHILDTSLGKPANNVPVTLWQFRDDNAVGGSWHKLGEGYTDFDGRCKTLLGENTLVATEYRLVFGVGVYFYDLKISSIYKSIEITFTVAEPTQHYHIPLLLTANGYTTYRGS